jgi:hypothetical protein
VDLQQDPAHCGACATSCARPNAQTSCREGQCVFEGCLPGFRDADGVEHNGCEQACDVLAVNQPSTFDADLPVVQVSGRLTLNGAPAPQSSPRGELRFELHGTQTPVVVTLPPSGEARYLVKLFAGTYRVGFTRSWGCEDPAALPCGDFELHAALTLASDGVLDLNLELPGVGPTVTVSGAVTLNGAPLPDDPSGRSRGQLAFEGDGATVTAPLGAAGPATYQVQLAPGSWDVVVLPAGDCAGLGVLPCQRSVRLAQVSLTTSGVLNLDLPVVQVSGAVTLNGQALPASPTGLPRGVLRLEDAHGDMQLHDLGTAGPAAWSALLYGGPHRLHVDNDQGCAQGPLPCLTWTDGVVRGLTAPGVVNLDLRVVQVGGQVRVNGQDMGPAPAGQSRGLLRLAGEGGSVTVPLGSTGPALFTVALYAGRYDAQLENATRCDAGPLPCGDHLARGDVPLTADGVLDLDVEVARVSGILTAAGAEVTASPSGSARGKVVLEGPTRTEQGLPPAGPASFGAVVYAGTYRVRYETVGSDCPTGPLPCQHRLLDDAAQIKPDTALSFDLPVLEVVGAVTLNGQPLAPSVTGAGRGELLFDSGDGPAVVAGLGVSGEPQYRVKLFPGAYRLAFRNVTDCPTSGAGALPCQSALLADGVPLGQGGRYDVDLKTTQLTGRLTVNGAPLPDSPTGQSRGRVLLAEIGHRGPAMSVPVATVGPAQWQTVLLHGRYALAYWNSHDCEGAVPCQQRLLAGCAIPTGP